MIYAKFEQFQPVRLHLFSKKLDFLPLPNSTVDFDGHWYRIVTYELFARQDQPGEFDAIVEVKQMLNAQGLELT